jgi:hypothetical protein
VPSVRLRPLEDQDLYFGLGHMVTPRIHPRSGAKQYAITEKKGSQFMRKIVNPALATCLCQAVKNRKGERPQEDADLGRAIINLADEMEARTLHGPCVESS